MRSLCLRDFVTIAERCIRCDIHYEQKAKDNLIQAKVVHSNAENLRLISQLDQQSNQAFFASKPSLLLRITLVLHRFWGIVCHFNHHSRNLILQGYSVQFISVSYRLLTFNILQIELDQQILRSSKIQLINNKKYQETRDKMDRLTSFIRQAGGTRGTDVFLIDKSGCGHPFSKLDEEEQKAIAQSKQAYELQQQEAELRKDKEFDALLTSKDDEIEELERLKQEIENFLRKTMPSYTDESDPKSLELSEDERTKLAQHPHLQAIAEKNRTQCYVPRVVWYYR